MYTLENLTKRTTRFRANLKSKRVLIQISDRFLINNTQKQTETRKRKYKIAIDPKCFTKQSLSYGKRDKGTQGIPFFIHIYNARIWNYFNGRNLKIRTCNILLFIRAKAVLFLRLFYKQTSAYVGHVYNVTALMRKAKGRPRFNPLSARSERNCVFRRVLYAKR